MTDRFCRDCGDLLVRRSHEIPSRFAKRKSCGCTGKAEKIRAIKRSPRREKPCAVCGELFSQREHEIPRRFAARMTCSEACRYELTGRAMRAPDDGGKECVVCGSRYSRNDGESTPAYRKRKTCGPACKAIAIAATRRESALAKIAPKPCPVCGTLFFLREGEEPHQFTIRVTCSLECSYAYRGAEFKGRERVSPYPKRWIRYREEIRQRDNHTCQLCGSPPPDYRSLPVHHINYDKHDLSPSNLITLCHSCHARTHAKRDHWVTLFTEMIQRKEESTHTASQSALVA